MMLSWRLACWPFPDAVAAIAAAEFLTELLACGRPLPLPTIVDTCDATTAVT